MIRAYVYKTGFGIEAGSEERGKWWVRWGMDFQYPERKFEIARTHFALYCHWLKLRIAQNPL